MVDEQEEAGMTDKLEEIRAELEQALPRNDPTDAANWAAEHGRRLLEIAEAAEPIARVTERFGDEPLFIQSDSTYTSKADGAMFKRLRTALSSNPDKEEE